MKHISQIKINTLLAVALLSLGACSKSIEDSTPSGTTNGVNVDSIGHSSFEVSLPENLRPLTISAYETYGVRPSIRFSVNEDNTLDTYWEGELSNTADGHRHLTKISLTSKSIVSEIPFPLELNLGNTSFLGYEYLGNDRYIMGASEVNANDLERTKPIYYCFDHTGKIKYTIDLWKNTSDANAPGRAGQAIIVYNKFIDNFGIYMGRRENVAGHQAGWLSLHEAATGIQTFSRPWYISHNFDQRLLPLANGHYVALAHADALPSRGLLVEQWKFDDAPLNRTWSNYFPIPKAVGGNQNVTNTTTGDLLELPNGNIAIVYTTQREYTADWKKRDVRLAILSNVGASKGSAVTVKDVWLTSYDETESAGWGAQLSHFSQGKIFIAWNVFNPLSSTKVKKTTLLVTDYEGNTLSRKDIALPNGKGDNSRLVQPSQTIKTTNDGKHLIFMSEGSAPNKLRVNLVDIN